MDDVIPPPTPYDNCDGSIMISVNGATGAYTVQWSNGTTGTSIAGLCTGTYTVTVSQGNCTITQTFETCCLVVVHLTRTLSSLRFFVTQLLIKISSPSTVPQQMGLSINFSKRK